MEIFGRVFKHALFFRAASRCVINGFVVTLRSNEADVVVAQVSRTRPDRLVDALDGVGKSSWAFSLHILLQKYLRKDGDGWR